MPTRIARGTGGLVSMIKEVARIAQEWGDKKNATSFLWAHSVRRRRRKPWARMPASRKASKSPLTRMQGAAIKTGGDTTVPPVSGGSTTERSP
jgi:hypothetical protein